MVLYFTWRETKNVSTQEKVLYLPHFLRDSRTSEECFIGANRAFI